MTEISIPEINIDDLNIGEMAPAFSIDDLPSQDECNAHYEQQSQNSSVLNDISKMVKDGKVVASDKSYDLDKLSYSQDQLSALFYMAHKGDFTLTSTLGIQCGLSSVVCMAAHQLNNKNGGHVPVELRALEVNNGIAKDLLDSFGFENYQIMEHEPCIVLPQLLIQNLAADLGLVIFNGSSSYDDLFVEFYFADRLVENNGLFVFNTKRSKEVKKLVKHIKKTRSNYNHVSMDCGLEIFQKLF